MKLSNKTYDTLKFIAWVALPLSAFVTTVSDALNVPSMKTVSIILIALDTLVGTLLADSNRRYNQALDGDDDE